MMTIDLLDEEWEVLVNNYMGPQADEPTRTRICPPCSAHRGPTQQRPKSQEDVKTFCLRSQFRSFSTLIDVYIGPDNIRYGVHKEVLTSQSAFFAACLRSDYSFVEAATQTIKLPDENPVYFDHFVSYLYSGTLLPSLLKNVFFKDGKPAYYMLLHLYGLADRLGVEKLRNEVIDAVATLADRTNSVFTPSDTYTLYESIRDTAPLRGLVLDLFAYKKTDKLLATHVDDWHPTFLRDLVVKLKRPEASAINRHTLHPWRPDAHTSKITKACTECRAVIARGVDSMLCDKCGKAFCALCVQRGEGFVVGYGESSVDVCRPWKRGRCGRYHEHGETTACVGAS